MSDEEVRRKHPKPPSTQRRMIEAQLIQSGQTNYPGAASLPAGTRGTAADLARTNLPSIASLAGPEPDLPGFLDVTFTTLAGYEFTLTKAMADGGGDPAGMLAQARAQIPADVQALDGKKVLIRGFLLPVKMNNGLAVEFLLMRNQSMCCYGVAPKVNEWVTVQMSGPGIKPVMDQPLAVAGVLHVGPVAENGCLAGLYRLDGEKFIAPF